MTIKTVSIPSLSLQKTPITCCCGSSTCIHFCHAQKHISQLEATLRTSAEVGQALLAQVSVMKDQIDRLNCQVTTLHGENDTMLAHNKGLIADIATLSAKLAVSDSQIDSLNQELEESRKYQAKMARVKLQTESLENQLELLEQVRDSMQNELHTSETDKKAAQARWRKTDMLLERLARDYELLEQQAADAMTQKSMASIRPNKTRYSVDSGNTLVEEFRLTHKKSETDILRDELLATRCEVRDLKKQLDKHDVVLKKQSRELLREDDEDNGFDSDVSPREHANRVFQINSNMDRFITPRKSINNLQKYNIPTHNLHTFDYPTPESLKATPTLYTPSRPGKRGEPVKRPSSRDSKHTRSSSLPLTPVVDDVATFDDSFVSNHSDFDESPTRHASHLQKELRHFVSHETTLRNRFSDLYDEKLPSSCSRIPELSTELGSQAKLVRSTSFESIFSLAEGTSSESAAGAESEFIQGHDAHFGQFQRTTLASTSAAATFTTATPDSGLRNFDSRLLLSQVNSSNTPRSTKKESSGWGFGGMWNRIKSKETPTETEA
ncbi:hypothetical protein CJU90_2110 [Yarrowia sp. C11]|nr:hypothetical protein CKK34_6138 [Yarrowia sp. E02]KAG5372035.1 hypothetical protein CJU90_2110 [Yarrowia sp. C11]